MIDSNTFSDTHYFKFELVRHWTRGVPTLELWSAKQCSVTTSDLSARYFDKVIVFLLLIPFPSNARPWFTESTLFFRKKLKKIYKFTYTYFKQTDMSFVI